MAKFFEYMHSEKGETVINITISLLFVMMLFALAITFLPMINDIITLNSMAHEVARVAEIRGEIGSAVNAELARLKSISRLDPDMTVRGSFIGSSRKMQLDSEFTVILTEETSFGIGGMFEVKVPITAKAVGRSEMYWK